MHETKVHVLTADEHRYWLSDELLPQLFDRFRLRTRYYERHHVTYEVWHPDHYLIWPLHAQTDTYEIRARRTVEQHRPRHLMEYA